MREKYPRYDLDGDYAEAISGIGSFHVAIIGRDPFPRDATSIPFVKSEWAYLDGRSAGYYLFRSLYGDQVEQLHATPRAAAMALLNEGVVLLNASYHFLEKETLSLKHFTFVRESLPTNYPILQKAEHVLLCGGAATMMKWVVKFHAGEFDAVPHPTMQARNGLLADDRPTWDRWWASGRLREWLQNQVED